MFVTCRSMKASMQYFVLITLKVYIKNLSIEKLFKKCNQFVKCIKN